MTSSGTSLEQAPGQSPIFGLPAEALIVVLADQVEHASPALGLINAALEQTPSRGLILRGRGGLRDPSGANAAE